MKKSMDLLEGCRVLLWIEYTIALTAMIASFVFPQKEIFTIALCLITVLNAIATTNLDYKIKKLEEK